MPVVLPEHLFPWLLKFCPQAIPSDDLVSEYWNHMAMQEQIPWVTNVISTGAMYVPIYLWGDDAVYNQRNEKIVAVVCGSWLDERKNSKDTVFPLFTYRSETRLHLAFDEICGITVHERACHQPHQNPQSICPTQELSLGFETLQAFMAPASWRPWWSGSMLAGGIWKLACEVVESLNRLSAGVAVDNRILRCLTTDFLGDWKWHRETLLQVSMLFSACMLWRSNAPWCTTTVPENCHVTFKEWFAMSAHWKANNICHACVMTKRDFAQVPNPLKNVMRRDLNDFISRATKPGDKST